MVVLLLPGLPDLRFVCLADFQSRRISTIIGHEEDRLLRIFSIDDLATRLGVVARQLAFLSCPIWEGSTIAAYLEHWPHDRTHTAPISSLTTLANPSRSAAMAFQDPWHVMRCLHHPQASQCHAASQTVLSSVRPSRSPDSTSSRHSFVTGRSLEVRSIFSRPNPQTQMIHDPP